MSAEPTRGRSAAPVAARRKTLLIIAAVGLQAVCALFFLGDVLMEWGGLEAPETGAPDVDRDFWYEALISLALVIGVVFGALALFDEARRARRAEEALAAASGAFVSFVESRFEEWRLTRAEADVALLTLKGFETKEIAELRSAAAGTVRAQLAKIYAKAGVASRGQFISQFIDDLIAGPAEARAA